ncbi:unnamed protein product [Menidia menidia]|uniref:(Atlantic silverside) hypothetical protein n=1 Tax=Menidia menidia TaxID=238744 RepID=A0A8S4BPU4_9TELE|nr:unnamed protein product [Menidia menidia]
MPSITHLASANPLLSTIVEATPSPVSLQLKTTRLPRWDGYMEWNLFLDLFTLCFIILAFLASFCAMCFESYICSLLDDPKTAIKNYQDPEDATFKYNSPEKQPVGNTV